MEAHVMPSGEGVALVVLVHPTVRPGPVGWWPSSQLTPLHRSQQESVGAGTQLLMTGWLAQDPLAQPWEG
ncbi:UNVERIFIED_CONTAM: hypothetical protein Sradi_7100100 [Sesamum radiatum]|uniref:Uncharacterized protein n=1 Tax=Sesamum radiatum TaxID=300843 RepID=A0AAW2J1D6_SESRA